MRRGLIFWGSGIFLGGLILSACFADKIVPHDSNFENRAQALHPPTLLHFWDEKGQFHRRPFIYPTQRVFEANMVRSYDAIHKKKCFLRRGTHTLLGVQLPARLYLLGTDSRGRDIFSRILYGARVSLSIGILGAFVSVAFGFLIGAMAGYFGGWLDHLLMRGAEFFIMIPALYLLLALRSALPPTLDSFRVYLLIVLILSLIGWGGVARVIRGMVLSLREREFVQAAQALGRKTPEILMRHILPHAFGYLAVIVSISIPGYIFGEAFLSVLGLGIQEPAISWGNMLLESLSYSIVRFHPWVLFPGLVIFLTALCLNVIGDGLKTPQVVEEKVREIPQ